MARRPSSVCPSVRPSVNFFAQIASTTTQMARLRPNFHTMISRRARIQGVLKVEVTGRDLYSPVHIVAEKCDCTVAQK